MDYRVYYNRHSDYPYIWSIDQGTQDTEINVTAIELHDIARVSSHYDSTVPHGSTEMPCVWFDVLHATLTVTDGRAHFFHDHDWRQPRLAKT
jgi:hypothetical protein